MVKEKRGARKIPETALLRATLATTVAILVVGGVYLAASAEARADLSSVGVALTAWWASALAIWRARSGPDRKPWTWLASGLVFTALGESYWAVSEVLLRRAVPALSLADLLYYTGFALTFVAFGAWMPRNRDPASRARRIFEAVMLTGALSILWWALFDTEVGAVAGTRDFAGAVTSGYPVVGSLLISLFVILALSVKRERRRAPLLLAAGFLSWAIADGAYAYQAGHGSYQSGHFFDLAWILGDLLIGLAALAVANGRPGRLSSYLKRVIEPHPSIAAGPERFVARLAALTSFTLALVIAAALPLFRLVDPTPSAFADDPADLIGASLGVLLGILYVVARGPYAFLATYLITGVLEAGLIAATWFNVGSPFGDGSLFLLVVPSLAATFLISPLTGFALAWGNAGFVLAVTQAGDKPIPGYLAIAMLIGIGTVMSLGAKAWLKDLETTQKTLALIEETQAIAKVGSWEIDLLTGKQHGTVENNRLFMLAPGEDETSDNILRHIHPEDRADVAAVLARVSTTGREVTETRILLPDGGLRWLRTHAIARPGEQGQPDRIVGYSQDVTDEKRHQAAAREADRLRDAAAFKTQFLNNAAHELANPLTPLRLRLATLRRHAVSWSPAEQKSVDLLERNVNRLSVLVNDLLDAARLQEGRLRLTPAPTPLQPLVEAAQGSLVEHAETMGVQLQVELPDEEILAVVDEHRLSQVLFNLTHNAIKFTPRDGEVWLRLHRDGADAVLEVQDSGIGLEPDQIAKLFEPFTQVHDTTAMKVGGTGLGLYISRGIVEQHGGKLLIASPGRNKGSTFSVRIPLAGRPPSAPPSQPGA